MNPTPDPSSRAAQVPAEPLLDAMSAARRGDTDGMNRYLEQVYDQLRRYAAALMRDESTAHTLQPTALANEAVARALSSDAPMPADPTGRFCVMATLMRRLLIDHARAKTAGKRGGGRAHVQLREDLFATTAEPGDLLDMDPHIKWLSQEHPTLHTVVMLHFFAGLTFEHIAAVLKVDERTVYRRWSEARGLLHDRLGAGPSSV